MRLPPRSNLTDFEKITLSPPAQGDFFITHGAAASLPLSWSRIGSIRPVYHTTTLPLSRTPWITWADIPLSYSMPLVQEDIFHTFPNGFVFRGCPAHTAALFIAQGCRTLRTGAEAVLDLEDDRHLKQKRVRGSLARGGRHGTVHEITLNEPNLSRLAELRMETTHAGKPQLVHLFRNRISRDCRCFVFQAHGGEWLGAMTLSTRGERETHTELLLRHRNAPGDIMECLVSDIFDRLRHEGQKELSLGEVPFIPEQASEKSATPLEQFMVSLMEGMKHAYDFEGLYRFKNKFAPHWRPVMLCSTAEPTPLLLAELAMAMGFSDLVMHESFAMLKQFMLPAEVG